ncbi:Alpha-(1,3)-fucosyltransferase 11 [Mortierella alpina]|uniref:Fucosyltransferase n=1 Tax=Mortierella alpina TaxID=64518 RepID=A0A9P6J398_MORAP|nr:Alpha-(1,3)-fucosyltransferase 11 [Mortierella alpina]
MPAKPVQAADGASSGSRTLKSKKMPVQDYPVLWWTDPPSPPPARSRHASALLDAKAPAMRIGSGAWLPFTLGDCGLPYTCTFSNDRGTFSDTNSSVNVVLFTGSKLDRADMPPNPRNESQAWVLNDVLKPRSSSARIDQDRMPDLQDVLPFTHTWSHRFGSDFVETVFESTVMEAVTAPAKINLSEKNRLRALGKEQGGRAPAAWIVLDHESDDAATSSSSVPAECVDAAADEAPSGRENYVRELQKLMDIDIYGGCLGNTPWPVHSDTQKPWSSEEIMREYKFVFVLERVNCEDYVTRSLADALIAGVVPIVDGPRDYSRFAPSPEAFLQLNTFISPELLAQELDALDRDDALYQKRLAYRTMADPGPRQQAEPATAAAATEGSPTAQALSPLFMDTFRHRPSKDVLTATTEGATEAGSSLPYRNGDVGDADDADDRAGWEPNRHGAYCGICQLAHGLAEREFDWKAHEDRMENRKAIASSSSSSLGAACESVPRYLPGLPAQMAAYDEYLQREHAKQVNSEESAAGGLKENENDKEGTPSAKAQSVKVTVNMDPHAQPPFGTLISSSSSSSSSSAAAAIVYHGHEQLEPDEGLLSLRTSASHPSVSVEVAFLLLLILVLSVGALVVAWATSKNMRRLMSWPWRRLYYSKIPQDVSLERIMLDELGEDLLYD